jgi:hypothetical protein
MEAHPLDRAHGDDDVAGAGAPVRRSAGLAIHAGSINGRLTLQ